MGQNDCDEYMELISIPMKCYMFQFVIDKDESLSKLTKNPLADSFNL